MTSEYTSVREVKDNRKRGDQSFTMKTLPECLKTRTRVESVYVEEFTDDRMGCSPAEESLRKARQANDAATHHKN